jgi:hypothetical protein
VEGWSGAYSECAGEGIEADVYLMYEICGVADAHEGAPGIDVVLPAIELLVTFEGEMVLFVFGFEEEAVRFLIGSLNVGYLAELDDGLLGRRLWKEERQCDSGGDGLDLGTDAVRPVPLQDFRASGRRWLIILVARSSPLSCGSPRSPP